MDFQFELDGVGETTGALERIRNLKRLAGQMEIAVKNIQFALKLYPPQIKGVHAMFVSDKQRRYFFAALADGTIQVPYRRTRTLGKRWTTKVEFINGGVVGTVGNVTPYAPLVQGRETQAGIHYMHWQTAETTLDVMANDIFETLSEAFDVEG